MSPVRPYWASQYIIYDHYLVKKGKRGCHKLGLEQHISWTAAKQASIICISKWLN